MRVLLTGRGGMLAQAIASRWDGQQGELVPVARADADLRDQAATRDLIARVDPEVIVHTAARVGGIAANVADPSGFLMDNLQIDANVLSAATAVGVRRLVYFGSSCMYPKDYDRPLVESDVMAAPLEPTNEGYALAKITAAKYCSFISSQRGWHYRVLIPSNLYGPHDDFSLERGHLVSACLAKAHCAKQESASSIDVWGDGSARREFTYVGDLAGWVVENLGSLRTWPALMNIGSGEDHSVLDYYRTALETVGYDCELVTDPTKPAGMKRKLMDSSVAVGHGWRATTGLRDGMRQSYEAYLEALKRETS